MSTAGNVQKASSKQLSIAKNTLSKRKLIQMEYSLKHLGFIQKEWGSFALSKQLKIFSICKKAKLFFFSPKGIEKNEFVTEYVGEIYQPWRWFEK